MTAPTDVFALSPHERGALVDLFSGNQQMGGIYHPPLVEAVAFDRKWRPRGEASPTAVLLELGWVEQVETVSGPGYRLTPEGVAQARQAAS